MAKDFFILHKSDGEIVNKKMVKVFFESLADGKYFIEASGTDKRTNPQNRYYFGLVIPLIQHGIKHLGHHLTKEEVHDFLKSKFNLIEIANQATGEYELFPQSTTRLNKQDFSEFIEKIQRWAAEFLSIEIPDPGEQTKLYAE